MKHRAPAIFLPGLSLFLTVVLGAFFLGPGSSPLQAQSPRDATIGAGEARRLIPGLRPSEARSLAAEGAVTIYTLDGGSFRLAPEGSEIHSIRRSVEALNPRMAVESLFVAPLPSAFPEGREGDLFLYNLLRRVSTMTGIEYYSASRDRMRVFYHESYAVADKDLRQPLPDPVVTDIPSRDSILVFQHDSSFGRNVHELSYRYRPGNILITMRNLTTMWYGIIPAIGEENLEVHLWVQRHEGMVLFYGNTAVDVPSLFGIETQAHDSFSNRLEALFNWFSAELNRALMDF